MTDNNFEEAYEKKLDEIYEKFLKYFAEQNIKESSIKDLMSGAFIAGYGFGSRDDTPKDIAELLI